MSPCRMAPVKIRSPRIAVIAQLLAMFAMMLLIDLLILDESVASALFGSLFTAIFFVVCMSWLARRAQR